MLFKSKIAASLLAIGLLASTAAVSQALLSGEFEDGTRVDWICEGTRKFQVPIQITIPEGRVYQAVLVCGDVV